MQRFISRCGAGLPRLQSPSSCRRRLATLTGASPQTSPLQTDGLQSSSSGPFNLSRAPTTTATLTPCLPDALRLLRQQPSHYVVASVQGRRYLLTPRDLLTVPRLKNVAVGETLRLDKVHELGSRDYTLRGDPFLPVETVSLTATVVEHTKAEMERTLKKKRRKGYQKLIEHKHTYTRLRIGDIVIGA